MKAQFLTGSKDEIAQSVAQIVGEVREAIVFVDEPSDPANGTLSRDLFAEMDPFTVQVGGADYSREALYSRMEGE